MTIRPELLLTHDFGTLRQACLPRDAILYELGVGLGSDADDLPFLHEETLGVLPPFAITLGSPGQWIRDPRFGIDFMKLVHIAQDVTSGAALPPSGEAVATTRVAAVTDRGEGRGAEVVTERAVRDADSGALYATVTQTLLLRADGGFGGEPARRAPSVIPERAPDLIHGIPLSRRAALIYRLSGDLNPLRCDPAFAWEAGFPRPILHGLASYAAAGIGAARALGCSPLAIARLACRIFDKGLLEMCS